MVDCVSSCDSLVQRQIINEEELIDKGISRYRKALREAKGDGVYADTMPGRWLTSYFIEPITMELRKFLAENPDGKPGPLTAGVSIIRYFNDPEDNCLDLCAYIALRTSVNYLMRKGKQRRATVRRAIERELADETQHKHMRSTNRRKYTYWKGEIDKNPVTVTKNACLRKLKENYPDLPKFETEKEKINLAAAAEILICCVMKATSIIRDQNSTVKSKGNYKTTKYLELSPDCEGLIAKLGERAESLWPKYEPMLCPPRPWTGAFQGGFVGPLGDRTVLVRGSTRSYLEDIHSSIGQMDRVLRALNAIQATPWRINKRINTLMREAQLRGDARNFGLPGMQRLPRPPFPLEARTDKKLAQRWAEDLKAQQRLESVRLSRRWATRNMLRTAKKFEDEEAIYFAYNLDWRGRIYPLSTYLSPQGEELHRAVLEFAHGLPLETDEAVEWLAIHGAGCFGYDKVSFADRVKWVRENEENIRLSVESPLDYLWWTQADKPWMFLAFCMDWVGYLEDGKEHVSHLPVAMDGSCNGLQNFAAMLRHEETARAVNLVPSDVPNDIYQQVADAVIPKVAELAGSDPRSTEELAALAEERTQLEFNDKDCAVFSKDDREQTKHMWQICCARWLEGKITRKLVKQPVMTYPYSVTQRGMRDQLYGVLLEMHEQLDVPSNHLTKAADMLKGFVFEAVQETVVAAAQAMRWLREVAKVAAKGNLPVKWVTPVGMKVIQHYFKSDKKRISTMFGGMQYKTSVYLERTNEVKGSKQAAGVSPNFVHSCDASHLMLTVLACLDQNITDFHMIHDSYGTHARSAPLLAKALREQFVNLYANRNVLEDFHTQLLEQLEHKPSLQEKLPSPPEQGAFDLLQVLNSQYFFA